MKKITKFICLCLVVLIMFPAVTVKAYQIDLDSAIMLEDAQPVEMVYDDANDEIQSLDRIVTRWLVVNNLLFFRRWNETRGFWVDPTWILYTGQI